MRVGTRTILILLALAVGSGAALAQFDAGYQDEKAVEVLKKMDSYKTSLPHFVIKVESYLDAKLDDGTIISNPSNSVVTLTRPGLLHSATDDGLHTTELYFRKGELTVFNNENNYYARVEVPDDLEEALLFALDAFDVETPLLDLLILRTLSHLTSDQESIIYVTDKSPIRGVDCHHIVVSGPNLDFQLWVDESDRPLPRKTLMTFKTAYGMPRHAVFLEWDTQTDPDPGTFEFKPPEGSSKIELLEAK